MHVDHSITVVDEPGRAGWVRLALMGRITVGSAKEFHKTALDLATQGRNVVVCCAQLEYLDASAIQIFLSLGRDLMRKGKQCEVSGVAGSLRELFSLVGLEGAASR